MQQYYYMDAQGQTQGPVGETDLRKLHGSGAVQDNTYVAVVGSTEWKPLSEAIPPATPPPPADGGAPPPPGGTGNPPPPNETKGPPPGRKCHELDYEVIGDDIQVVEIELAPGETVIAEAGAMNYMEDGIQFEVKMGDGSKPEEDFFGKQTNSDNHVIGGEAIFMTHFTNNLGVKKEGSLLGALPRQDPAHQHGQDGRRDPLPKKFVLVRSPRHGSIHRLHQEAWEQRGLHFTEAQRRWHGISPCRWHRNEKGTSLRNTASRCRLHCGFHLRRQLRPADGRQAQVDVPWKTRACPWQP